MEMAFSRKQRERERENPTTGKRRDSMIHLIFKRAFVGRWARFYRVRSIVFVGLSGDGVEDELE